MTTKQEYLFLRPYTSSTGRIYEQGEYLSFPNFIPKKWKQQLIDEEIMVEIWAGNPEKLKKRRLWAMIKKKNKEKEQE